MSSQSWRMADRREGGQLVSGAVIAHGQVDRPVLGPPAPPLWKAAGMAVSPAGPAQFPVEVLGVEPVCASRTLQLTLRRSQRLRCGILGAGRGGTTGIGETVRMARLWWHGGR